MPPDGSDGQKAAADSFEIPPWLQAIQKGEDPINSPAKNGKWTFQLHPYGQILWLRSWQVLNWVIWGGAIICLVGLLSDILSSSATLTAVKHVFLDLKNPLFDIVLLIVFVTLGIILFFYAKEIKRRIIRHRRPSKDPKPRKDAERFFVRVDFGTGVIDWATEFIANQLGWPKLNWKESENEIKVHPSTIQNILPRLYYLQESGRIKLRFDKSSTYIFESCRWLFGDILVVVIWFVPAIVTFALSIVVSALRQASLFGIAASAWVSLAVAFFALGIAVTLAKFWQRWKASRTGVAVIFSQDRTTATLAWNQHLSLRKGFHSVAVLLYNATALSAFCRHLWDLQKGGKEKEGDKPYLFKLTQYP